MKILKIYLENFRQFYGKQEIVFSKGEKNITVIFGENGKGKTSIFRALIFALFGNKFLEQDNEKEKIHLVNFNILDENIGCPVEACVKVEFEENGKVYFLERSITGYKVKNEIVEKVNKAKLYMQDSKGNYSGDPIVDENFIKSQIEKIISSNIKDFFLFDGEKIDALAKTNILIRKKVKQGIVQLLQIDKLDKSIEITKNLYNKENKLISTQSSNMNIKSIEERIEDKMKKLNENFEVIKKNEEELEFCKEELDEIDIKLSKSEPIKRIQEESKNIKVKIKEYNEKLNLLKGNLSRSYFNSLHQFFMKDSYEEVKEYLNQLLTEQKDLVSIEIIDKILLEMKCICGTNLNIDKEALKNIEKIKNEYKKSELTPLIRLINEIVHDFSLNKDEIINNIRKDLLKIKNTKDELNKLHFLLEKNNDDIKEYSKEEENLTKLEEISEKLKTKFEKLKIDIRALHKVNDDLKKNINKEQKELEVLMSKDKSLRADYERLKYLNILKENFENIFEKYSSKIRKDLSYECTKIFNKLIDIKNKNLINEININEKYEIELKNWSDIQTNQDISQGQRQIIALSFITALAKIASGGRENIEFPLFMDTPLARISGENRDNIIDNIPELTVQWILLLTDTEFTVTEELKIKSTQRLGKWYILEQIKNGYTKITSKKLDDSIAKRR
ncbi:DNA sulfur modification protein DndD [Hypnocyclicus thermotrophus]|uniref:DNA sulfur modification protein DndD n=1 Tax=Hypnocyclicus thermotrophus TaxID=1627895 RepID=A0AA46I6J1_9FUSO|nr:AAA family ATPase [Hypnocyclicus thermotrophus]TDT72505.1 DNA sulfur modification protein DndD [Hypnocyclicus thermotrophus]